ncbi:transcriptional regulator-domain-containing protein [Amylocystis lapponica]|nr:transcriptional regulator-domain-containing protein [Amylocystis lapponica]
MFETAAALIFTSPAILTLTTRTQASRTTHFGREGGPGGLADGSREASCWQDIVLAVRTGGNTDPRAEPHARSRAQARQVTGVPKGSIESALKKAMGEKKQGDQLLTYEAMAPGSIAVIIECTSNNVNRTSRCTRCATSSTSTSAALSRTRPPPHADVLSRFEPRSACFANAALLF